MNDHDSPRRDPFIARRSDLNDDSDQRHRAPAPNDPNPDVQRGHGGGVWKFVSLLSLCGLIAVGGFAWQQSVAQAELLARFDELAGKINSTDESLNQSGAAMSLKLKEQADELDKHWSEIKKLWALVNETQRKAIADNKAGIDGVKARLDTLDKTLKDVSQSSVAMKTAQDAGLKKIDSASSAALAASASVDDMGARVKAMGDKLASLDKSLKESQSSMSVRVRENEQAIRSIDTFRREMNQQLQELRQKQSVPANTP